MIHACVVDAAHAQPLDVPTVMLPAPPALVIVRLVGVNRKLHALAACVTVNVRPAIVRVPVRGALLVLGATVKFAEPLPEPFAPAVTVIHAALLAAAHVHPVVVVTVADPLPPAAATDWLVGARVKLQAAAACEIVNVCEAIVRVPVRADGFGLAAALKPTNPLPLPLAPLVTVIQLAFETADHVQPEPAVTPTLPVVTPEPTDCPVELMDGAQGPVNEKPFDAELPVEPPGPIAMTRASNTTLGAGALCRSGRKSTRMTPPLGAGLPRSMVSNAIADPTTNTESEYRWTSGVPSPARVL